MVHVSQSTEAMTSFLPRPTTEFIREVQQEGHMKVAFTFLDFGTREDGEAFAVRMEVENPNKIRQQHLLVRPDARFVRNKRVSLDLVIRNHDPAVRQ